MKKNVLRDQFVKRQAEKEKRNLQKEVEKEDEESDSEGPISATQVSKKFLINKRFYPYKGNMPEFLTSPIRAYGVVVLDV